LRFGTPLLLPASAPCGISHSIVALHAALLLIRVLLLLLLLLLLLVPRCRTRWW
jgi:hypothetical protein